MSLESVLVAPLKRMESYIHDLQELRSHTPTEHIDYNILQETVSELEIIQKVGDPMMSLSPPQTGPANSLSPPQTSPANYLLLHAFVLILVRSMRIWVPLSAEYIIS